MAKDPSTISSSTQEYLDINDIVNDIVILNDGGASLIMTVEAVNFGLLAEAEQDAIMYAYAGLLNSLNFNLQIIIRSQTKDVSDYIHLLDDQIAQTFDERKKAQIQQYRQFVTELITQRNVLDKKFYVIVNATPLDLGLVSAQSVIPGVKNKTADQLDKGLILDKAITNLHPKRDHIIAAFARVGLYARQLATQEIIELFYLNYNPEASEGQELTDTRSYTTPLVQAGFTTMQNTQPSNNPQITQPAPTQPTPQQVQPVTQPVTQQPITQPPASMPAQPPAQAPQQPAVQPMVETSPQPISPPPAAAVQQPTNTSQAPAAPQPAAQPPEVQSAQDIINAAATAQPEPNSVVQQPMPQTPPPAAQPPQGGVVQQNQASNEASY